MFERAVRLPTDEDFARAREVIAQHLTPTPLWPTTLAPRTWLKLDMFQPTGSFKVRGALAAMDGRPADRPMITASAGNHALGIAHAASVLGRKALVVVPETVSTAKLAALRGLPVQVVTHGDSFEEAEAWATSRADAPARDIDYISPYNDPDVIAGQATLLDEIVAQHDSTRPLTVVAGAGGGGLISGMGLRATQLSTAERPIRIVGVEAEASPALSIAVEAGRVETVEIEPTFADGLAGNMEAGSITVELVKRHVAALLAVTEGEIADAIRWLVATHGLVAEGAAAVAIAAVRNGSVEEIAEGGDIVVVVCGRNIAPEVLSAALSGGHEDSI